MARSRDGRRNVGEVRLLGNTRETLAGGGDVPRLRVMGTLRASLVRHGLAVLMAERGMGKRCALMQTLARCAEDGSTVGLFSFGDTEARTACRRLRAVAHEALGLAEEGCHVVLGVEGPAEVDDEQASAVARCVEALMALGCRVILSIEPEAELIVDELPPHQTVRAHGLLVRPSEHREWSEALDACVAGRVSRLTHGIPALVAALRDEGGLLGIEARPTGRLWVERVGDLASYAMRRAPIEEERRVRAVMLLLGSGSLADIEALGVRPRRDLMRALSESAPFFGIDAQAMTFEVVWCEVDVIASALCTVCEEWPELVDGAVRHLCARGELRRAGGIAVCCLDEAARARLVAAWPAELLDAGLVGLALEVMGWVFGAGWRDSRAHLPAGEAADALGWRDLLGLGACRGMLLCLDGSDHEYRSWAEPERGSGAGCLSAAGTLDALGGLACQDPRAAELASQLSLVRAWREGRRRSAEVEVPALPEDASPLVHALDACARVGGLLARGSVLDAFRELMLVRDLRARLTVEPSLWAALLQCAFEDARRVLGDPTSPGDDAALLGAEGFLALLPLRGIAGSCRAARQAADALAGMTVETALVEREVVRCSARGDLSALARVHALAALVDVRRGALRHAHVHASEARSLARDLPDEVDASVLARIAARAASYLLGDAVQPASGSARCSPDVRALDGLHAAVCAGGGERSHSALQALRETSPRTEVVLVADLLAALPGTASARLRALLPRTWRDSRVRPTKPLPRGRRQADPARVVASDGLEAPRLEVCLLGGMSVRIGGVVLSERDWRRRNARLLLALLAITRGHALSRHRVLGLLWPGSELARSRENLYSVLSSLRAAIGQAKGGAHYLCAGMGRVWLDESLVRCDVDALEDQVSRVLAAGEPLEEIVEGCRRIEAMWHGGLFVPSPDPGGLFRLRHDELSRRFVDAMLVGAEACLRQGNVRMASWLARAASQEDDLREDVVACLLRCLVADGRRPEADEELDAYLGRVGSRVGGAATSLAVLRERLARLGEGVPGGGGVTLRLGDGAVVPELAEGCAEPAPARPAFARK